MCALARSVALMVCGSFYLVPMLYGSMSSSPLILRDLWQLSQMRLPALALMNGSLHRRQLRSFAPSSLSFGLLSVLPLVICPRRGPPSHP